MLRGLGSRILGVEVDKSETYTYRIKELGIFFKGNGDDFGMLSTDAPEKTIREDFGGEADRILNRMEGEQSIEWNDIHIDMNLTKSGRIESIMFDSTDLSVVFKFLSGFFINNQIDLYSDGSITFNISKGHADNRTEGGLKRRE